MYKLECSYQTYAWGQPSQKSLVTKILRKNKIEIDESKPFAEYWMGTHINGPSKIKLENETKLLSEHINGDLPYLFKVLSVEKPLSIQLHPDKDFAKKLHESHPDIYKDSNHKPELFIALDDFELLFGFISIDEAIKKVEMYKNEFNLKEANNFLNEKTVENYESLIKKIIFLTKEEYELIIKGLLQSKETKEDSLIKRLYNYFGLDLGILVSMFMNHFFKKKGDSIFISANYPHAYIHGNCMEAMACSDNVIRLGLTPKLVDRKNFEIIIDKFFPDMIYDENIGDPKIVEHISVNKDKGIITYDKKGIDDFKLQEIEISTSDDILIEKKSIIFILEGNVKINDMICEEYNTIFVENEITHAKVELIEGCNKAKFYIINSK